MVKTQEGMIYGTLGDAKGAECSVCGCVLKFEESPQEAQSIGELGRAVHCGQQHIITSTAFRMTVAPEVADYGLNEEEKKKQRELKIEAGEKKALSSEEKKELKEDQKEERQAAKEKEEEKEPSRGPGRPSSKR